MSIILRSEAGTALRRWLSCSLPSAIRWFAALQLSIASLVSFEPQPRQRMVILVILVSVLVTLQTVSPSNLCSTAGLCCKHRDSECVAQKVFPNHTVDTSQLPCYCDHACIRLDDCCTDYKHFCAGKI